jgi:hypothetical protein
MGRRRSMPVVTPDGYSPDGRGPSAFLGFDIRSPTASQVKSLACRSDRRPPPSRCGLPTVARRAFRGRWAASGRTSLLDSVAAVPGSLVVHEHARYRAPWGKSVRNSKTSRKSRLACRLRFWWSWQTSTPRQERKQSKEKKRKEKKRKEKKRLGHPAFFSVCSQQKPMS